MAVTASKFHSRTLKLNHVRRKRQSTKRRKAVRRPPSLPADAARYILTFAYFLLDSTARSSLTIRWMACQQTSKDAERTHCCQIFRRVNTDRLSQCAQRRCSPDGFDCRCSAVGSTCERQTWMPVALSALRFACRRSDKKLNLSHGIIRNEIRERVQIHRFAKPDLTQ